MEVIPARLLAMNGKLAGTIYPLFEGITAIGRDAKGRAEHRLRLDCGSSTGVSRFHALLRATGDGIAIQDVGSMNGTYIRDLRLLPEQWRRLEIYDTFRLGELWLSVLYGNTELSIRKLHSVAMPMGDGSGCLEYRGLTIEARENTYHGSDQGGASDGSLCESESTVVGCRWDWQKFAIIRSLAGDEYETVAQVDSVIEALAKIDALVSGEAGG